MAPAAEPPRSRAQLDHELGLVTPEMERRVGISRDDLASLFVLDGLKGFGPQKFKELHDAGLRPIDVLVEPERLPTKGARGESLQHAIRHLDVPSRDLAQARAARQLVRAHEHNARILTYDDPLYPRAVFESNNPVPVLYARGKVELLCQRQAIACVGSRETGPPYAELHSAFVRHATERGWLIVSGFALGADTIGHRAALEARGKTVLVMPCGLDRPFPPENKSLWYEVLHYSQAAAVSEFPFGTAASTLTLRKRNKLIVALARAVLISQSTDKGGAMNAYRFAREQRKPVATFEPDGQPRTSGNRKIALSDTHLGASLLAEQPATGAPTRDGVPATVLPIAPSRQAWDQWLLPLSSST